MEQNYFDYWKRLQGMRGMTQKEIWRLHASLMRDTSHTPSTGQMPVQTATIDDKPVMDEITTTTLEEML